MMLYRNMKAMVHSSYGDINFFEIVAWVFQGHTLAPYSFIICLSYILWMSVDLIKENGFTLKRQEADNIPQKLWQMQTMLMIQCFLQMHLPSLNHYCIAWIKQPEALISIYDCVNTTLMLTKQIKKKLDWNYTRIVHDLLNKSWKQHPIKQQLYDPLSPISQTKQVRKTSGTLLEK